QLNLKENDVKLFHFLTGNPYVINDAESILQKNINDIKNLIQDMKFIPFPLRIDAILLEPKIVKFWNDIGYDYKDFTNLTFQGLACILFSPRPNTTYIKSDKNIIIKRYKKYINLGFKFNKKIVASISHVFEDRINDVGDIFVNSFSEILEMEKRILLEFIQFHSTNPRKENILNFVTKKLNLFS
ncbi:15790_t:CDS:2, partial [Cetraspora pellucida]